MKFTSMQDFIIHYEDFLSQIKQLGFDQNSSAEENDAFDEWIARGRAYIKRAAHQRQQHGKFARYYVDQVGSKFYVMDTRTNKCFAVVWDEATANYVKDWAESQLELEI